MTKNLHIFNDQLGFFTNKTVAFIENIDPLKNSYLNTAPDCKNQIEKIKYKPILRFLINNSAEDYKLIIFHSYNYANKDDIKKIKKSFPKSNLKFIWVFWSHEYYQLPEFFHLLYQGFSRKYYLRKIISFHVEQFIKFCKGHVDSPFYLGLKSLKKTFSQFDVMASLIKDDFNYVMKDVEGVDYSFVSYISLIDFPHIEPDFSLNKTEIMIGHSGSPILNHYEIVKSMYDMKVDNTLHIPLAYGKPSYIKQLRKKIETTTSGLNIVYQLNFMTKDEYYKKINHVGYFILNSYCQQALGNIAFFLWTGTKIFLRENTSTYQTLKKQSFHIYSIETELTKEKLIPLTLSEKQHNRDLISSLISEENVKAHWLKILNFTSERHTG